MRFKNLQKIKYLTIVIITCAFAFKITSLQAWAATDSAEVKPAISTSSSDIIDKLKKIELLKEKIATKVSELRNKEKGAVTGTINKISGSSLTLATSKGEINISILDDATIFSATDGGKTTSTLKKLKAGDNITAFGYNNQSISAFEAKYVYINRQIIRSIGKISDIDKSNYTVTIKEPQANTVVDIETYSKIYTYDKEKGLVKGGFTKLKTGDLAFAIGTPNAKDENKISAIRIIVFSYGNPTPTLTASKETTPSANPTK